jgi:hypothetical protein
VLSWWTEFLRKNVRKKTFKIENFVTGYDDRPPSPQNAIDLIPGWSSAFPDELGLHAGPLPVFSDKRIAWALERFGDVAGRNVLELGPLEAGHTAILSKAGAYIDAIEANKLAYIKCLIAKEIMGLQNTKFLLGDFIPWLEQSQKRYDLIVASGVLYHMREPLRLLKALSQRTNSLYLWTTFIAGEDVRPSTLVTFNDVQVRLYRHAYGRRDYKFCGGPIDHSNWMHRDDILAVLRSLGFANLLVTHEEIIASHQLPTFSVFAERPTLP